MNNDWNIWNRQLELARSEYVRKAFERLKEWDAEINALLDKDEQHDQPMREVKREGNVVYIGRSA